MHFKRKPSREKASRLLALMEEIAPLGERTFFLYPALRLPFGTYSPSAPHFEGECPDFRPWERIGSGPWKRID